MSASNLPQPFSTIPQQHVTEAALSRFVELTCTFLDQGDYECGAKAAVQLLPDGEEARCLKHLGRGRQL
jgi:hypothetical protein